MWSSIYSMNIKDILKPSTDQIAAENIKKAMHAT